jgi:MFS family permease
MTVLVVTSVLCVLAPTVGTLIACRVLQGIGGNDIVFAGPGNDVMHGGRAGTSSTAALAGTSSTAALAGIGSSVAPARTCA